MNGGLCHLCTYRLNLVRRTSWGWWDEWDDKGFEIRALGRGSPKYWIFTSERGRNILFLWNLEARVGFEPANHGTRAPTHVHKIAYPGSSCSQYFLDTASQPIPFLWVYSTFWCLSYASIAILSHIKTTKWLLTFQVSSYFPLLLLLNIVATFPS